MQRSWRCLWSGRSTGRWSTRRTSWWSQRLTSTAPASASSRHLAYVPNLFDKKESRGDWSLVRLVTFPKSYWNTNTRLEFVLRPTKIQWLTLRVILKVETWDDDWPMIKRRIFRAINSAKKSTKFIPAKKCLDFFLKNCRLLCVKMATRLMMRLCFMYWM